MKILLNWSNFKIFQIKYNEWVSNFGIFENQKLNKMTSNVNETSIMIHMRLTACRLDTCATSGRCYTSDLLRISICQRCFNYFIYVVCAVWTTFEQGSTHRPGFRVGAIELTGSGAWIPACEYDGGGVRWWTTSGIEIFVNWLTGTFNISEKFSAEWEKFFLSS